MGVEVLVSRDGDRAALYCNTTDWTFGPVITTIDGDGEPAAPYYADDIADAFLEWFLCGRAYRAIAAARGDADAWLLPSGLRTEDPRTYSDRALSEGWNLFRAFFDAERSELHRLGLAPTDVSRDRAPVLHYVHEADTFGAALCGAEAEGVVSNAAKALLTWNRCPLCEHQRATRAAEDAANVVALEERRRG